MQVCVISKLKSSKVRTVAAECYTNITGKEFSNGMINYQQLHYLHTHRFIDFAAWWLDWTNAIKKI